MPVKAVEGCCCFLARNCAVNEDRPHAGMQVGVSDLSEPAEPRELVLDCS